MHVGFIAAVSCWICNCTNNIFCRCIFKENRAESVSAVGLFMFGRVDRKTLPVLMEDV